MRIPFNCWINFCRSLILCIFSWGWCMPWAMVIPLAMAVTAHQHNMNICISDANTTTTSTATTIQLYKISFLISKLATYLVALASEALLSSDWIACMLLLLCTAEKVWQSKVRIQTCLPGLTHSFHIYLKFSSNSDKKAARLNYDSPSLLRTILNKWNAVLHCCCSKNEKNSKL